ncbi:3'-5' exonuclease isoform X2 [Mercurialis annua]|uniref:3'-5' exonuclease isoform X2 n=1 Tax=Mercurialis annua TaxID=3986 RepID=UPI0024AE5E85|nr:3'-5' exonuclease isoform X2 [Mercurialis annua]
MLKKCATQSVLVKISQIRNVKTRFCFSQFQFSLQNLTERLGNTMHNKQFSSSSSSYSPSSRFPSVSDWEQAQPLTDEDLQAIDAIEATFFQQSTNRKKRHSPPQNDNSDSCPRRTRRQLPNSVLGLLTPFSLSPCRTGDYVKMRYPAMKFGGKILYSRTPADVDKAARELLKSVESIRKETSSASIGFDIEWKPTFKKGVLPGKAAVMQLCIGTDHCHVMHIFHSGIPESLQFLLEDSTLIKVGAGIGNDCVKVFRDYKVSVKAVEDLSYLANKKLGGESKSWGLQSLAEMLVCKEGTSLHII